MLNKNNRQNNNSSITTSDVNNTEYFTQHKQKDIFNIYIYDFHTRINLEIGLLHAETAERKETSTTEITEWQDVTPAWSTLSYLVCNRTLTTPYEMTFPIKSHNSTVPNSMIICCITKIFGNNMHNIIGVSQSANTQTLGITLLPQASHLQCVTCPAAKPDSTSATYDNSIQSDAI